MPKLELGTTPPPGMTAPSIELGSAPPPGMIPVAGQQASAPAPAPTLAQRAEQVYGFDPDLERATLLDMFPQTGHMEVVGQLTRRDGD